MAVLQMELRSCYEESVERQSPFFVNLSKSRKGIEVPEKEWYSKEKSRLGG